MDSGGLPAIIEDLGYYFKNAREDDGHNANLAQPFIRKWGNSFALMSSTWVVNEMQTTPHFLPSTIVLGQALRNIWMAQSLVKAYGEKATAIALSGVMTSSDEDNLATQAYILASNDFAHPRFCGYLKPVYDRVIGTSCKLTLAFALHQCGDSRELRHFYDDGYLCAKFLAIGLLDAMKRDNPDKTDSEVERMVLDWHAVSGIPQVLGVIGILALDNWSRGKFISDGYLAGLPWIRKTYDD